MNCKSNEKIQKYILTQQRQEGKEGEGEEGKVLLYGRMTTNKYRKVGRI